MKSKACYELLAQVLEPLLLPHGFKRERGMLTWTTSGGAVTGVRCQTTGDGWDDHAGSRFAVSVRGPFGGGLSSELWHRLPRVMTVDELQSIQAIHNNVMSEIAQPPSEYYKLNLEPMVTRQYLKQFRSLEHPPSKIDDHWFRYYTEAHVQVWARFIRGVLERLVVSAPRGV